MAAELVLAHARDRDLTKLAEYEAVGGYTALAKARGMTPQAVIDEVTASELRGRGGAFFPTGRKWAFIPKPDQNPNPHYLVVNADESEPGSFKDNEIMATVPHRFIEGCLITAHAVEAARVFVYIRGEYTGPYEVLVAALDELKSRDDILGSVSIVLHRGAGAYICGEETALLESLEGKRGLPRVKPPFPATHGLYNKPTVVNNVETLANLPHIINRGPEWFASIGSPPKSTGTRIFCVSGHVKQPGNYEVPMGVTFRELIYEHAGGMRSEKPLKSFIPGGASAPFLTPDHLDVKMDFESVAAAGSMLGSGGVTVMEEGTSMVWAALSLMEFFYHESCGKCSPCREGSSWLVQTLRRIVAKQGRSQDLETLSDLCKNIAGRTVCAFGDAEVAPIMSTLDHWRSEYTSLIYEAEAANLLLPGLAVKRH